MCCAFLRNFPLHRIKMWYVWACLHTSRHTRTLTRTHSLEAGRAGVRHVFVYELGSFVWPSHAGEGLNFRFVSISTAFFLFGLSRFFGESRRGLFILDLFVCMPLVSLLFFSFLSLLLFFAWVLPAMPEVKTQSETRVQHVKLRALIVASGKLNCKRDSHAGREGGEGERVCVFIVQLI